MKLENLLESVTSLVYHFTYPNSALDILKTNKFILRSTFINAENREKRKKFYFLSTSHVKFGGYAIRNLADSGVILVLDGSKFNQRYFGKPIDYWGRNFQIDKEKRVKYNENEERIYSDKPTIPNARKYIKEIHVYVNDKKNIYINDIYRDLLKEANKFGIPIYFYTNKTDFKTLNKRKALKISTLEHPWEFLNSIINLLKGKITEKDKKYFRGIINHIDILDDFDSYLHSNTSNRNLQAEEEFFKLMKKYKYKDLEKFVKEVITPKIRKLNTSTFL